MDAVQNQRVKAAASIFISITSSFDEMEYHPDTEELRLQPSPCETCFAALLVHPTLAAAIPCHWGIASTHNVKFSNTLLENPSDIAGGKQVIDGFVSRRGLA